jgi:Ca-activated chloride channel family protein
MKRVTPLTPANLPVAADSDAPGFGALKTAAGLLPLKALQIEAHIAGLVAETTVRQTFINAFPEPLEAVYIFPLPPSAAVTQFTLTAQGRRVEGALMERTAAHAAYSEALRAGHRAALAEQDRQDVFTISVGNLPPGEAITVDLQIVSRLPCEDGEVTFRFPLVVAPRYIPGRPLPGESLGGGTAADTDAVPDASRITPPVLLPGFPNPVQLSLQVDLDPGDLAISDLRVSLHSVLEEQDGPVHRIRVRPGERLDRDFVLRFRIGAEEIRTALQLSPDPASPDEGTFLLTVMAPVIAPRPAKPRTVAFVLDRSGSMAGWKLVAARRALARMVAMLRPEDRFSVLAFDDVVEMPPGVGGPLLLPATERHRVRAVDFLCGLQARGGTVILPALDAALATLGTDPDRDRLLVLVSDGQIGNDAELLRWLHDSFAGVQVFVIGVDQAPNAGFLERLARATGGRCELVEGAERLEHVLDGLHERLHAPLLTALRLAPQQLTIIPETVAPARVPVCFATTPLVIAGRYRGQPRGGLTITATDSTGRPWTHTVTGTVVPTGALATTWARAHVLDLEDDLDAGLGDRAGLTQHIIDTSLRFHVLSRFTAYVAIDQAAVIDGSSPTRRVIQPVDLPAGWDPEAVGLARRQASPIAFRTGASPVPRRASRAAAYPVTTKERVSQHVGALLGQLDQRAAGITPRPDRLRRLRTLAAELQTVLGREGTPGLSDTDLGLLEAAVKHLQRLLELATEIDEVARALHRLIADLRTRALGAPPRPSVGRP